MKNQTWPHALPRKGNAKLKRKKSVSTWFEIYQLNDFTFAILEPNHWEEVISYLIIGQDKAVLFDSGMGIGNMKAEIDQLISLPIIVVNSHAHYDHIGGNRFFDEIWMYDNDHEINAVQKGLSHDACMTYMTPDHYLSLPDDFDLEGFRIPPKKITRRLRHGENIDLGGRTLSVHHTPGESPGQICLLDDQYQMLFTADTFVPGSIPLYYADSRFKDYIKSIHYMVDMSDQVKWLCSSHNEAMADKTSLLRLKKGLELIKTGRCPFERENDIRIYQTNGFKISLPDSEFKPPL